MTDKERDFVSGFTLAAVILVFVVAVLWGIVQHKERRTRCEELGGVLIAPYKSQSVCIKKEAVIEE